MNSIKIIKIIGLVVFGGILGFGVQYIPFITEQSKGPKIRVTSSTDYYIDPKDRNLPIGQYRNVNPNPLRYLKLEFFEDVVVYGIDINDGSCGYFKETEGPLELPKEFGMGTVYYEPTNCDLLLNVRLLTNKGELIQHNEEYSEELNK